MGLTLDLFNEKRSKKESSYEIMHIIPLYDSLVGEFAVRY
jgi:hypothetical protein